MPAQPYREGGEREAEQAGAANRRDGDEPEFPAIALDEECGDRGADAEERRLAEVELPGVPDHEVERQREQHVHRAQHQDAAPVRCGNEPGQRSQDEDAYDKINSSRAQTFSSFRSARSEERHVGKEFSSWEWRVE